MRRFTRLATTLLACLAGAAAAPAMAEDASGMALVGMDPLQARSAYQLVPHRQNGRWLLYVGHHPGKARNPLTDRDEENGVSVLDVTDPVRPRYLHHYSPSPAPWIAGAPVTSGSYHLSVCDGADLPNGRKGRTYMLRTAGDYAHEVVDVTDPLKWRTITQVVRSEPSDLDKAYRTHNSSWDCKSGLAIVVASKAGWHAAQIYQAIDLSDPEKPRHIRDFDLPGSEPGSLNPSGRVIQGGNWVNMAHGSRIADGRIYLSYNPFWSGTVQILDLQKFLTGDPAAAEPLKPTAASLAYPQIGRLDFPSYWGIHTSEPIMGMPIPDYSDDKRGAKRDILVALSEGVVTRCERPRAVLFLLDITEPETPTTISTFQSDAKPGRYCDKFAFFGPHNVPPQTNAQYRGKLLFVTYFAAGLRVVDIRDPFRPVEVGHYVPDVTANTRYIETKGPLAGTEFEKTPLTNDVAVDDRGLIYISDRARTGVHILKLTGKPAEIAGQ